ncbi:hypothetical protein HY990_06175 [Candidatus Micrarchaeota archaeon]|nr:hypothetical protein [Candidatus Micrarchaeota archaeon]
MLFQYASRLAGAPQRESEPEQSNTSAQSEKSATLEEFLKSSETKQFIREWSAKTKDGKQIFKRRGISELLSELFPSQPSNKKVLNAASKILKLLGGMDGLDGFLAGLKAKSEGIMSGIKNLLGS